MEISNSNFKNIIRIVLFILWFLCIIGIFINGDLEGGRGIISSFANLAFLPIVIIPIWFIFGKEKILSILFIICLFLTFVFIIAHNYFLANIFIVGSIIFFLILIGKIIFNVIKQQKLV